MAISLALPLVHSSRPAKAAAYLRPATLRGAPRRCGAGDATSPHRGYPRRWSWFISGLLPVRSSTSGITLPNPPKLADFPSLLPLGVPCEEFPEQRLALCTRP